MRGPSVASKARVVDFSSSPSSMKASTADMKVHPGVYDAETAELLAPGMSKGENVLRWGFIRKVSSFLAADLSGIVLPIPFAASFC